MKNRLLILAALSILALGTPILAQQSGIRAEIPFDFNIGSKTYAAGEYAIGQATDDHGQRMIWVLSNDQKTVLLLARSRHGTEKTDKTCMVFNRYGEKYFLAGFVTPGVRIELPTSREEREIQKGGDESLAKAGRPEEVLVEATVD